MKIIRVFGPRGAVLRELFNVSSAYVLHSGALEIRFIDADQPGRLAAWVAAPGKWNDLEEWNDELPDAPDPPVVAGRASVEPDAYPQDALPLPFAGFTPPGAPLPQPLPFTGDPLALDDASRLRVAMTIECICDSLRCPYVTATLERDGQRGKRRCNLYAGHGEQPIPAAQRLELPHQFGGDPWPYGVHNHAPLCPRHPSRYNAGIHPAEGQPKQAGATAATEPDNTTGWLTPTGEHAEELTTCGEHCPDSDHVCSRVAGHPGAHSSVDEHLALVQW